MTSPRTTEPLTVAGPRRIHTGFQLHGPFTHFDCKTRVAWRVGVWQPPSRSACAEGARCGNESVLIVLQLASQTRHTRGWIIICSHHRSPNVASHDNDA
jgi:hypothetical protein